MSCCRGLEEQFDDRVAKRDLRRYRRRGPSRPTRRLLAGVQEEGVAGASVLDVGGGVGAIQHELLAAGAGGTTDVDASPAYLAAAREEGGRRGAVGRMRFVEGDFVRLAGDLPPSDVVTLDRVICCYPDREALIDAAAGRSERLLGLVYPRSSLPFRLAVPALNFLLRLRGTEYRIHIHDTAEVDAQIRGHGFELADSAAFVVWQVFLYRRRPST